jgi:zona occludens toxin (predicted ATPase)
MIVLLTGVPGSGKSYLAVKTISDLLKDKNNVVLSNIEDFRFERFKLYRDYQIKKISDTTFVSIETGLYVDISKDLVKYGASFFEYDNMKKILSLYKDKKVFIFIDECQRYFPKWFKDSDVIYFFDYHRHFGVDIYLISQSSVKICSDIVALSEYELRAVPSSLKFKNMFVYKRIISGDIIGRQILKKDRRIFNLYKSFYVMNDNTKVPSFVFLIPVFFIIAIYFAYSFFAKWIALSS